MPELSSRKVRLRWLLSRYRTAAVFAVPSPLDALECSRDALAAPSSRLHNLEEAPCIKSRHT